MRLLSRYETQLSLLRPRVKLDLVRVWQRQPSRLDLFDVGFTEVAHADCPCFAEPSQFAKGAPLLYPMLGVDRYVDQVEVNVVELQARQARVQRGQGGLVSLRRLPPRLVPGPELRRDEDVVPRKPLLFEEAMDRRPDSLFVFIPLRSVDVPVADAESTPHRRFRGFVRNEVRAEPHRRDLDLIGQIHLLVFEHRAPSVSP
jgi:hypothetical protein